MRKMNQLATLRHYFQVLFICSLCLASESKLSSSPDQIKADSFPQLTQNCINGYDKYGTIFTQRLPINQKKSDNQSSSAEKKQFSMFNLVRFPNEQCTVGSLDGFCVTSNECSDFGGSSIGSCARDFGTCCYKAINCGESSSMNVTYIQNADYPSTTSSSGSCSHSITRQDNVCKLRLDFIDFELSDPYANPASPTGDAENGKCQNDQMTVNGVTTTQLRYLCGKMPPIWHFYLDVRDASNPTTFTFSLSSAVTKDRKWNIKVTQIDCDRKIPQGCGQYFTGTTGDPLYSFNYGNTGIYLHGMNYAICFRQEKGYCTHSFVDSASPNSWIVCTDSLAFPSVEWDSSSPVPGAAPSPIGNNQNIYDCLFINTAPSWPNPIITNNYSPTMIYHFTDADNVARASAAAGANVPGFYFTWTHNKC